MSSPKRTTAPPRAAARVSGAVLLDQRRLAEEILGKALVDGAVATMAAREEFDALLPISWCNVDSAAEFHHAVARAAGLDPSAWHRKVVRVGMERTFTTFWRFLVRIATVEAIVKRAAVVYAKGYDRGSATARLLEPGLAEMVVSGWPGMPDFEIDGLISAVEAILHIAGRASATVKPERNAGGVRLVIRFK